MVILAGNQSHGRKAFPNVCAIVHSFSMKRLILIVGVLAIAASAHAQTLNGAETTAELRNVYNNWRASMVRKDARLWKRYTSTTKQIKVRNRIWSERRPFPQTVFASPIAPPDIEKLQAMRVRAQGRTAKATYFGKVDFGIGGDPTDNLFVISYVREGDGWKYHGGEFVNLGALPVVRQQLAAGNKEFLDGEDFFPSGVPEVAPFSIRGPVKYIAKAYVFCPGREVKLLINRKSRHTFQNTKRADVIVGGAIDGMNELQFSIKDLPGGDAQAPISIRVYLMSEVNGVKPLKPLEYQIDEAQAKGETKPKASGTLNFNLGPEMVKKLKGR